MTVGRSVFAVECPVGLKTEHSPLREIWSVWEGKRLTGTLLRLEATQGRADKRNIEQRTRNTERTRIRKDDRWAFRVRC